MWLLKLFIAVSVFMLLGRALSLLGGVFILLKRIAYFAFWLFIVYIAVVMYCCI